MMAARIDLRRRAGALPALPGWAAALLTLVALAALVPGAARAGDLSSRSDLGRSDFAAPHQDVAAHAAATAAPARGAQAARRESGQVVLSAQGDGNAVNASQRGRDNQATLEQLGSANTIDLSQNGNGNVVSILEAASNERASVKQAGNGNTVQIELNGNSRFIVVEQTGNNRNTKVILH